MLPSFIIAGAGKSGTTTLWEHLKEHPEVCMAQFKEPGFFTQVVGHSDGAGDRAPSLSGRYCKGLEWYESLFRSCDNAKARGEASTIYMVVEDAPVLMKQVVPDVKILFILRDPVERLYSQYWQERKLGWKLPDFGQMVQEHHPRLEWYVYVSSYHVHLTRYLEEFSKHQLSLFLYEDLRYRPKELVRGAFRAVGVDPSFLPKSLGRRYNAARLPRIAWAQRLLNAAAGIELAMTLPTWFCSWLGMVRQGMLKLNSAALQYHSMRPKLREELMVELTDAISYVEHYLQRPIPSWWKI
jgi:hypothetical protein